MEELNGVFYLKISRKIITTQGMRNENIKTIVNIMIINIGIAHLKAKFLQSASKFDVYEKKIIISRNKILLKIIYVRVFHNGNFGFGRVRSSFKVQKREE